MEPIDDIHALQLEYLNWLKRETDGFKAWISKEIMSFRKSIDNHLEKK